eukprot:CAMPEP_0175171632 /NCGR_PEP_ID=MMETSP0087-20121206/30957_1 /TAXON_ID=136419 /ORGANISM="Unknown Unknown, Strain D1" /LENGTH=178 /DNA_ID=CAMNT_0016462557 /DNA_START=232 /DNA_END=768 /DNA_ORIENTATION=+
MARSQYSMANQPYSARPGQQQLFEQRQQQQLQQQQQQQQQQQEASQSARMSARPTTPLNPFTLPPAESYPHFKYGKISAGRDYKAAESAKEQDSLAPEIPAYMLEGRLAAGMGYGTKHNTHFKYISQRGEPKKSYLADRQHHFVVSTPDTYLDDYNELNHPSKFTGPDIAYFSKQKNC